MIINNIQDILNIKCPKCECFLPFTDLYKGEMISTHHNICPNHFNIQLSLNSYNGIWTISSLGFRIDGYGFEYRCDCPYHGIYFDSSMEIARIGYDDEHKHSYGIIDLLDDYIDCVLNFDIQGIIKKIDNKVLLR